MHRCCSCSTNRLLLRKIFTNIVLQLLCIPVLMVFFFGLQEAPIRSYFSGPIWEKLFEGCVLPSWFLKGSRRWSVSKAWKERIPLYTIFRSKIPYRMLSRVHKRPPTSSWLSQIQGMISRWQSGHHGLPSSFYCMYAPPCMCASRLGLTRIMLMPQWH